MNSREYVVSEPAVRTGRASGLYGNTAARIRRMSRRAAPVTSEHGNRRFNEWFMLIEHGEVKSVTRVFDR